MAKKTKKPGSLEGIPIRVADDGGYLHYDLAGEIEVEGCRSITEYNSEALILNFGDKIVSIFGKQLEIRSFSHLSMTVCGEFERLTVECRQKGGDI